MSKNALNVAAPLGFSGIPRTVILGKFDVVRAFFQNAISDAVRNQPSLVSLAVITFVGIGWRDPEGLIRN